LLTILKSVGLDPDQAATVAAVDSSNKSKGLDLSFVGLGGDSLAAVRFASEVKLHFNVELPITVILSEGFQLPELISKLKTRRAGEEVTITTSERRPGSHSHSLDVPLDDDITVPSDQPRFEVYKLVISLPLYQQTH